MSRHTIKAVAIGLAAALTATVLAIPDTVPGARFLSGLGAVAVAVAGAAWICRKEDQR